MLFALELGALSRNVVLFSRSALTTVCVTLISEVIAFEPFRPLFQLLAANLVLNGFGTLYTSYHERWSLRSASMQPRADCGLAGDPRAPNWQLRRLGNVDALPFAVGAKEEVVEVRCGALHGFETGNMTSNFFV